jgi:hypothetical protein
LQVAGRLSVRLLSQLLDWWRNETIVSLHSDHLQAARAPLQCMPDLPQNTFPIAAPLVIPEPQHLNALGCQELISRRVVFLLPRQPVFKTVQFNGQPSRGTIKVKKVSAERTLDRVLPGLELHALAAGQRTLHHPGGRERGPAVGL